MFQEPKAEVVLERLDALRNHRWSSYPAYALKEIGEYTGMNVKAVSQGESRIRKRLKEGKLLKEQYLKILKLLGEENEL